MSRWSIKSYLIALFWIPWAVTLVSIGNRDNYCTRVIDGDTIVVTIGGQEEKVRLIGVDTPETVHPRKPVEYFGKEASEFTRRMVEGKGIRLEYDWQTRDKYRRLLAYVYIEDGTFLNAEIIKQGYGFAYTRYPFKHLDDFRQYEKEAREHNRGLWGR
jgi:micrococcal nuclease